jgi:hypothetical protein
MVLQNVAGVLTGRGLMDCLQYYDSCLLKLSDTDMSKMVMGQMMKKQWLRPFSQILL